MRVVLDTGVVISALLFAQGRLVWLRGSWSTGAVTPVVCRETVEELIRVLAYPKFQLTGEEIRGVLAAYLPFCETAEVTGRGQVSLPRCSDHADQKFLELASLSGAETLVTGDRALLTLAKGVPFAILSPGELRKRL